MLTIACKHCGRTIESVVAPTQCPDCGQTILISVSDETQTQEPSGRDATLTYTGGVPRSEAGEAPLPGSAIPGYTIVGELGRGGMGVVYRAREVSLNRLVALKVLLSGTHAGSRELARFRAEAEAAAAVQHPNIVQVFAIGQHAGLPYLALEFVPGGSLTDRLASGPIEPKEAARIVRAIARGVQAAHEKGVIHRDLKPANILFDSTGEPKVADFGLAKMEDTGLTASGAIMGTPAYMAPEQARGDTKAVGNSADIWALGVILYECVSGRQPFRGQSAPETLRLVCEAGPNSLRGVPKDMGTIVAKCLEKQPAHRYASAKELADDLSRFLDGDAVTARRRSAFLQPSRWVARHRKLSYALAGACLALAAALFVQWLRLVDKKPDLVVEDKPSSDLLLVPPDAFAFITVRPGSELDRPDVQRLLMALLQIRPDDVEEGMLRERIEGLIGLHPNDVERATLVLLNEGFRQEHDTPAFLIVLRTKAAANLKAIRTRLEESFGTFELAEHRGRKYDSVTINQQLPLSLWKAGEKDLVFGQTKGVLAAIDRLEEGQAAGTLSPELELASQNHTVVASSRSLPPLLDLIRSKPGEVPDELIEIVREAGPATVTMNLLPASEDSPVPGFDVEFRLRFPDDARAATALPRLRAKLLALGKPDEFPADGGLEALLPALRTALRTASMHREHSVIVISVKPRWSGKELLASKQKPRMSTDQKLKQIGLAMHNYEAAHGRLPTAATRSADGKPLFSWRVELLPYLEHDGLYRAFNRKEAWDHPDNKPFLDGMPDLFAMDPTDPAFAKNRTRFQVVQAKGGVFDGDTGTKLTEIADGTVNTLLVVEAGEPILWTRPDELRFDPKGAMPKLGNPALREFLILRGDASTQPIARDISAELFRPLVTKNANDTVQWGRLRAKVK